MEFRCSVRSLLSQLNINTIFVQFVSNENPLNLKPVKINHRKYRYERAMERKQGMSSDCQEGKRVLPVNCRSKTKIYGAYKWRWVALDRKPIRIMRSTCFPIKRTTAYPVVLKPFQENPFTWQLNSVHGGFIMDRSKAVVAVSPWIIKQRSTKYPASRVYAYYANDRTVVSR